MSLITKNNTFSVGATIFASEHNENYDTIYNDYNGNITNANVAAGAAIADTKLAQITTASKVAGDALTSLANVPAGAGELPIANIPSKDEDNMASDSASHVPTQQSTKAYVDNAIASSAWDTATYSVDTSYQSSSNALVFATVIANASANTRQSASFLSDSANPPTTSRASEAFYNDTQAAA